MSTLQVSRYHPILVALHWALAILIIADLTIGALVLVHIPNDVPRKIDGLRAHMSGGIVILTLMLLRLAIRVRTTAPAQASAGSAFLDRVGWLSHRLLYLVVFAMALSGLVMGLQAQLPTVVFLGHGRLPTSFWDYPLRSVHYLLSRLLMTLIALHVSAALYHTFIRKDHLLRRMWFGRRNQNPAHSVGVAAESKRSRFWDYAPWVARIILAVPALLFIRIGTKHISEPLQVAAGSGMVLGTPAAITDTRAVGAIFLAIAALTLFAIFSTRRLLAGLLLVTVVIGFVTAARVLGLVVDGATPETIFKLTPEVVLLIIAGVGTLVEIRRQSQVNHAVPVAGPIRPQSRGAEARTEANPAFIANR